MKIHSYNLMCLEQHESVITAIKAMFTNEKEALLLLQEAKSLNPDIDFEQILSGLFPKAYVTSHTVSERALHAANLITISNLKPKKIEKVNLPQISDFIWKILFKLVRSDVPQHRALICNYDLSNGSNLTVVNLHLDVFGGRKLKTAQMLSIKKALEKFPTEAVIIAGDFNISDSDFMYNLVSLLGEGFQVIGSYKEATVSIDSVISKAIPFNSAIQCILKALDLAKIFSYRCDWFLVKGLSVKTERVLKEYKGSDHYPIFASLE